MAVTTAPVRPATTRPTGTIPTMAIAGMAGAAATTGIPTTATRTTEAMTEAMRAAGLQPQDIDYIAAHGTGTPLNDVAETVAIKQAFGEAAGRLSISSPKSMVGHLLGGAGAVGALAAVFAVYHDVVPPTINLHTPDPECDLDYTPLTAKQRTVRAAAANGFGFGGQNGCVIFRKYEQ